MRPQFSLLLCDFMKKRVFVACLLFLLYPFSTVVAYEKVTDFSFDDLEGKTHQISEYRGKWVLVNYWATYCPPCLAEMPEMNRFYQKNKSSFMVLGFDAGGTSVENIKQFIQDNHIRYPLIPMQQSTLLAFGVVMAIPTSYIISPSGEIVDKFIGVMSYQDLDYYVNPEATR